MSKVEKEIKLKIGSTRGILKRIVDRGFRIYKKRHFEDNFLFDFEDKKLLLKGCILRLRVLKGKGLLTYKEPSSISSITKGRNEIETEVKDSSSIF